MLKILWYFWYFTKSVLALFITAFLSVPLFAFLFLVLPVIAKKKRNLPYRDTLREIPNVFIFAVSNIIPFMMIALPLYLKIRKNKAKIKYAVEKYDYDLTALKVGDVILTGKDDWGYSPPIQLSNILSSGEDDRYWTHACIYSGNNRVIEAQAGGLGVVERDIVKEYVEKGYKILALRHKSINEEQIKGLIGFCRKRLEEKCKYDKWGVSFYVLTTLVPPMFSSWLSGDYAEKLFNVSDAYFCSELVADAFKEEEGADCPVFSIDSWCIKPLDFKENLFFMEVEGLCLTKQL